MKLSARFSCSSHGALGWRVGYTHSLLRHPCQHAGLLFLLHCDNHSHFHALVRRGRASFRRRQMRAICSSLQADDSLQRASMSANRPQGICMLHSASMQQTRPSVELTAQCQLSAVLRCGVWRRYADSALLFKEALNQQTGGADSRLGGDIQLWLGLAYQVWFIKSLCCLMGGWKSSGGLYQRSGSSATHDLAAAAVADQTRQHVLQSHHASSLSSCICLPADACRKDHSVTGSGLAVTWRGTADPV